MTTGTQHQPPPPSQQQPATTVATDAIPGSPSMMATTAPQLKTTASLAGKKRPAPSSSSASENNGNNNDGSSSISNNNINKLQPQPLNRVGKDGEPLSEKKLRRLEKNRLSARECRRRKREATENMQGQINQLEGENLRLRLQLQVRVCVRIVQYLEYNVHTTYMFAKNNVKLFVEGIDIEIDIELGIFWFCSCFVWNGIYPCCDSCGAEKHLICDFVLFFYFHFAFFS